MSKLVNGVAHISVTVTDELMQTELDFYTKALGMTIEREWIHVGGHRAAMIDAGDGIIEVFSDADEKLSKGVIGHFALGVDSTDAAVEAIREFGCEVTLEPVDIEIDGGEAPLPARIAFVIGPGGEEIELFQAR